MKHNDVVRLIRSEISYLKNVEYGCVDFMNYTRVKRHADLEAHDIVGIYGQNGSGKTTMVEALDIMRYIMSGGAVPYEPYSGMLDEKRKTVLTNYYFLRSGERRYNVKYTVVLQRKEDAIEIQNERLTYWLWGASSWIHERTLDFENPYNHTENILDSDVVPEFKSKHIKAFQNMEYIKSLNNLSVYCAQHHCSIFYSELSYRSFENVEEEPADPFYLVDILRQLNQYATNHCMIIKVDQLALTSGQNIIPFNIHDEHEHYFLRGTIPLVTKGYGTIPKDLYQEMQQVFSSINIALRAIIPNLQIQLNVVGEETNDQGITLCNVQLFSVRNGKVFSTKYESEGIKRIISILSCLIAVYNNENVCLVVDELDAGIFEYLLGELLGVLYEEAKGQLIFTSHNFRAFEKLGNKNIICSTMNSKNRYIHLTGIQKNNNRRDFYIRSIVLGGQQEDLYDADELESISYAFRRAGENSENDSESNIKMDELKSFFASKQDNKADKNVK